MAITDEPTLLRSVLTITLEPRRRERVPSGNTMSTTSASPTQFEPISLPKADPCVIVIFGATGDLTSQTHACGVSAHARCLDEIHIPASVVVLFQTRIPQNSSRWLKPIEQSRTVQRRKLGTVHQTNLLPQGELDNDDTYTAIASRLEELATRCKPEWFVLLCNAADAATDCRRSRKGRACQTRSGWSRIVVGAVRP